MSFKSRVIFKIKSLNQEKLLNKLSKDFSLFDINRIDKQTTIFSVKFFDKKNIEKTLLKNNVKIEKVRKMGFLNILFNFFSNFSLIFASIFFVIFLIISNQFVWRYKVFGNEVFSEKEIVTFLKEDFSNKKNKIDSKEVEKRLLEKFDGLSFVSCIIRGQTLVVNVKEKLLPEEMYGEFAPIKASADAKISSINLVSGTLKVKVGDFVKKGDVLVEPFVIDSSGNKRQVEASAEIFGEVYDIGTASHFEKLVFTERTGRVAVKNDITLFGLKIYDYHESFDFKMCEEKTDDFHLINGILLPFKMTKTYVYELVEKTIESNFDDVKDEYIEKAHQNALKNCRACDKIKEEFYTAKSMQGVTIVSYCLISEQMIGEICEN